MYTAGCDSVFCFIVQFARSKLSVTPKFIRYMLYRVAKICQILGQSDAKSVLMEDCDRNFLVMHRENLNAVEADTRKPAVSSIPWSPVTYLSSTSWNTMEYYGKRQRGEAASTNMIMTVSHIVRGLASDLRGGVGWLRCQKTSCQVWNSESAQRRGGVFADRPLVRPDKPQPRPSDVCVSSLMKKFWYLGETLLSAEQTLPPLCPRPPRTVTQPSAIPSGLWPHLSLTWWKHWKLSTDTELW